MLSDFPQCFLTSCWRPDSLKKCSSQARGFTLTGERHAPPGSPPPSHDPHALASFLFLGLVSNLKDAVNKKTNQANPDSVQMGCCGCPRATPRWGRGRVRGSGLAAAPQAGSQNEVKIQLEIIGPFQGGNEQPLKRNLRRNQCEAEGDSSSEEKLSCLEDNF